MNVLVTGGAGFIGSHVCKLLARNGFVPVVLDNLSMGHPWAVRWGALITGDIANTALIRRIIRDYRISAVVHLAASAYVGESMQAPQKYFTNNVAGTIALLNAMLEEGIRTIVFSSTCATYGLPEGVPLGEDHPQIPVNPYGESKLAVEKILQWYGRAYGLRWIALRFFNAAGADPGGELGEEHTPETHLIPLAIRSALNHEPMVIYGSDYKTEDGSAVRDYVHVTDLADAHVRALNYILDGGSSRAFNLGTGKGFSVCEVVDRLQRIARCSINTRLEPRRPGDPPILIADAHAATEILSWRPMHSSLDEILSTAWSWFASDVRGVAKCAIA